MAVFSRGGFERLSLEEELQISAHHQVRRKSDLVGGTFSFGQIFVQDAVSHAALRSWALVNRRSNRALANFVYERGEQIGGDDS